MVAACCVMLVCWLLRVWLLIVGGCLQFVERCVLFVVCDLPHVIFAVCVLLLVRCCAASWLLFVACFICCALCAACCLVCDVCWLLIVV